MPTNHNPIISIVIDDLGMNTRLTRQAIQLDSSVTLSFLPYALDIEGKLELALGGGHEILLHMPMEPENSDKDPGPNALLVDLDLREMLRRLRWAFDKIPCAVGLNNHMGSKFTADENGMATVIGELTVKDLIYIDSRTTPHTVGARLAQRRGLRNGQRDIFLDNDRRLDAIRSQLKETEHIALKNGKAIAIGHPYPETLEVIKEWIPEGKEKGFSLVSISKFTLRLNNRN